MIRLRRLRALANENAPQQELLGSGGASVSGHPSNTNSSIGFVSTVMSAHYHPKVPFERFARSEREFIGQGRSFRVEKTYLESDTDEMPPLAIAVKTPLDPEDPSDSEYWSGLRLEVLALLHPPIAAHPNIVDLLAIGWEVGFSEKVRPILAMPFATFGALDVFQKECKEFDRLRVGICWDVACGLQVLHGCGIVHGDLKSENVLVFWETPRPRAKLCDFGCSIVDTRGVGKLLGRSQPWNCPEWREAIPTEHLHLTDIYSFGLLFWRTMSEVNDPFRRIDSLSKQPGPELADIEELKRAQNDRFLDEIKQSFSREEHISSETNALIGGVLGHSVRLNPRHRGLAQCLVHLKGLLDLGQERASHDASAADRIDIPKPYPLNYDDALDPQGVLNLPWSVQVDVFEYHLKRLNSPTVQLSTEDKVLSYMWLFICHLEGIGTESNEKLATKELLDAAKLGGPVAKALSWRAIVNFIHPSESPIPPQTLAEWLLRSMELGCVEAREDFAYLVQFVGQHDPGLAQRFLRWYKIALMRLRNCTAGVGAGYFLDPQGTQLDPLCIHDQAQFEKSIKEKEKKPEFDINEVIVNARGDRILHFACSCGFASAAEFLVRHFGESLDANVVNEAGETPLLSASRAGQSETVQLLLRNGADLRASKSGESPLHWLGSFTTDISEIAHLMITSRDANDREELKRLLSQKASRNRYSQYWNSEFPAGTPLHRAVHFRNPSLVRVLLKLGADPEEPGTAETQASAVQLACYRQQAEILEIFLDHMGVADINEVAGPPFLHLALSEYNALRSFANGGIRSKDSEDLKATVALLVNRNADARPVMEDPKTPTIKMTALYKAVSSRALPCVEVALLLTSRDLLNAACGSPPLTPLNLAIENGDLPIVKALIAAGANPRNDENKTSNGDLPGITALHSCALIDISTAPSKTLQIYELLRPQFSNMDILPPGSQETSNRTFESAFVLAVRLGQFQLAGELLDHGANIDFEFNRLVRDPLDSGDDDPFFATGIDDASDSLQLLTTLLGLLLHFPTPALIAAVRFLLGYDDKGRKKLSWKHNSPSPIVTSSIDWTVWHAVASRRENGMIYPADAFREIMSYLSEAYGHLGPEFVSRRCRSPGPDEPGKTALHVAAKFTNTEVVAELLRMGADREAVDDNGARPVDYALTRMTEDVDFDEERGWTEKRAREESRRRKDVYIMLGGSMEIFETDAIEDLAVLIR